MATYSFPALGFDPAPGDPDAIDAVARDCQRCAQDLAADADQLQQLTQHIDWRGEAADTFAVHPPQLHEDLLRAGDAHGRTGSALASYAAALRQAQLEARRLERDAAEARMRANRHAAEVDRLTQSIDAVAPNANTPALAAQQGAARLLQGDAEDDYQRAVDRAGALQRMQQEAGDRAASRIHALTDAPYHEPGVLARTAGGVAEWVGQHAEMLREVSNVLKTVSAIAGALSFVPVLTPIFAPITALAAGGALLVDGALVATGHGDWRTLAVDAALLALPGAGRLTSRIPVATLYAGPATRGTHAILAVPRVGHPRLQNIVDNLYKAAANPNRVGNGTTMDAIRSELSTGQPTHGTWHLVKGAESAQGLTKWLARNPDAPYHDRLVAQSILDELRWAFYSAGGFPR